MELPIALVNLSASIENLPGKGKTKLQRWQVRQVCHDPQIHPLVAYACVMAWGGRNFSNYRLSVAPDSLCALVKILKHLRGSKELRKNDFAYIQQAATGTKGLGISFYTKLLFFFREKDDAYILDQWTAKSAIVLFPACGVRLNSAGLPRPDTSPVIYEDFCRAIEGFRTDLGPNWTTGEEVERTLFDRPRGEWRTYLKRAFPAKAQDPRRPSTHARARTLKAPVRVAQMSSNPSHMQGFAGDLTKRFELRVAQGLPLPGASLTFHKPNRLFCQQIGGVLWQFILTQHETRAQVYFGKDQTDKYNRLIGDLGVNHRPLSITWSGPRRGATRRIDLAVGGGYASAQPEWPDVVERSVQAMNDLFEYIGDQLRD
jgi:hypothetical protein